MLAGAGVVLAHPLRALAEPAARAHYAAARRGPDGRYSAAIFDDLGRDVSAVPLPGRGHDLTVCPRTRRCVVFARRPGNFAVVFAADRSVEPISFMTPLDRHFYGHGVFSRDGRLLYATENDFEAGQGVIGIYDATHKFERIGEFPSYGIGPHDLALLRGAPVIVVANGGLREHPDFGGGRRILNPGAIEASLVYIDLRSGALLERHDLGKGGKISLRHLDVARGDTIVVGAQLEKGAVPGTPLVFVHRRQKELEHYALPDGLVRRMSGYISSVAVDRSGDAVAATSSRGAVAIVLDVASGKLLRRIELPDISGVAAEREGGGFLMTTGLGLVAHARADEAEAPDTSQTTWQWDNHAVSLNG
ncbi:MAG: DUF1513 domain-containing protein [Hyphomicrobiaceae bacterium]